MIERLSGLAFLGGTSVLCLLFGIAVWAIAKITERRSFLRARYDDLGRIGDELVERLRHGDVSGADRVLLRSPSIEAALLRPALDWLDGGPEAIDALLAAQRAGNRRELERSLAPIGIVARQAPWVGAFGAILSLCGTLRLLAREPPKDLAGALLYGASFALLPAAFGVVIGVATTIAHDVLSDEIAQIDANLVVLSNRVLALLRFKSELAREFGLRGDAASREATANDGEIDSRRPPSIAELD